MQPIDLGNTSFFNPQHKWQGITVNDLQSQNTSQPLKVQQIKKINDSVADRNVSVSGTPQVQHNSNVQMFYNNYINNHNISSTASLQLPQSSKSEAITQK